MCRGPASLISEKRRFPPLAGQLDLTGKVLTAEGKRLMPIVPATDNLVTAVRQLITEVESLCDRFTRWHEEWTKSSRRNEGLPPPADPQVQAIVKEFQRLSRTAAQFLAKLRGSLLFYNSQFPWLQPAITEVNGLGIVVHGVNHYTNSIVDVVDQLDSIGTLLREVLEIAPPLSAAVTPSGEAPRVHPPLDSLSRIENCSISLARNTSGIVQTLSLPENFGKKPKNS